MTTLEKFKLSTVCWDSDKDPGHFFIWLENFGCLVRATEHGYWLEDMLDSKLNRRKVTSQGVPSFLLEDPDFAVGGATTAKAQEVTAKKGEADSDSASATFTGTTTSSHRSGHFSLGSHTIAYVDLPEEAQKLDGFLYNILRMNIRGSKQALLSCVTFPSYVQGVCVLEKHMGISRMERVMSAFSAFDRLSYNGNVLLFQTQFMGLKRELDNCGASITHYVLCKLMAAFAGKSKTVQFKIAEDFNKIDLDSPDLNLYDLIQRYCSELAAVDGVDPHGNHRVNHAATVLLCTHCKGKKHGLSNCPRLSRASRKRIKDKLKAGENFVICYECNEEGHVREDCPKLAEAASDSESPDEDSAEGPKSPGKGTAAPTPAESKPAEPSSSGEAATVHSVARTGSLSPEALQQLLSRVRGSHVSHVKAPIPGEDQV